MTLTPLLNSATLPPVSPVVPIVETAPAQSADLKKIFFGKENLSPTEQGLLDQKIAFVSSRDAYAASLAVVQKHASTIERIAGELGVPKEVAIGVALLENGGSETAVSPAGALGVFQLMPKTARGLGLEVDKSVDERKDPEKNIRAGLTYLKQNFERFGDWGLATWAYHAGEGNVQKALNLYSDANGQGKVSVNKLLSSSAVKGLTKKLKDDSAGYPYKVIATSTLFERSENSKKQSSVIAGSIVAEK